MKSCVFEQESACVVSADTRSIAVVCRGLNIVHGRKSIAVILV